MKDEELRVIAQDWAFRHIDGDTLYRLLCRVRDEERERAAKVAEAVCPRCSHGHSVAACIRSELGADVNLQNPP